MKTARDLLRRAARPLPVSAHIALKAVRARLGGVHDSAPAVARLQRRERDHIESMIRTASQEPGRRRILVCAIQQSPPWLEMTCSMALALRLRGHDVRGLRCDGLMPICEMNLGGIERPRCEVCAAWLRRYPEAFGLDFSSLGTYSRPEDVKAAHAAVREARSVDLTLSSLVVDGVDLAPLASRELRRFRRGYVFEPEQDEAYVSWLLSGILLFTLIGRALDAERPDTVVQSSGRTLVAECVAAAARARGIRVVTWDTDPLFQDGLVFSHDRPAVSIPLDDAWKETAHSALTEAERTRLHDFLSRWSRSEGTPFPYNPSPLDDPTAIRSAIGLRAGRRVIAAFANSAWDMVAVDRDVGFASMFDWIFALVEYARAHPEVDLVVRAHPAEVRVSPDLVSRTPVAETVRARCHDLPSNVKLVDGASQISSYVLAEMADVVMVYATRFGLEVAVNGKRPWVAGDVTYRGKGFTRDVASRADMLSALEEGGSDALSDHERDLAERFAYLWFFRYVTRLPLVRRPDGRFTLDSISQLASGSDHRLDHVCEVVAGSTATIDL